MKTHTIRKNGQRTGRILTFTPSMEAKLLESHPWAMQALIDLLLKEVNCSLDYEQSVRLNEAVKPIRETDYQEHLMLKWLLSGVRLLDSDLITILNTLDTAARRLLPE